MPPKKKKLRVKQKDGSYLTPAQHKKKKAEDDDDNKPIVFKKKPKAKPKEDKPKAKPKEDKPKKKVKLVIKEKKKVLKPRDSKSEPKSNVKKKPKALQAKMMAQGKKRETDKVGKYMYMENIGGPAIHGGKEEHLLSMGRNTYGAEQYDVYPEGRRGTRRVDNFQDDRRRHQPYANDPYMDSDEEPEYGDYTRKQYIQNGVRGGARLVGGTEQGFGDKEGRESILSNLHVMPKIFEDRQSDLSSLHYDGPFSSAYSRERRRG